MPLSPRDRRALLWGGAIVAVLLLYLLLRDGGNAPPPAEQIQADVQATIPESPPLVLAVAPPPVVVVATPVVDVSQLHLVGLLSRGAVIAMADGSQRFVPVGR